MPWLVRGLATGFAPGSLQFALAVELGRITFPYLLLISLAALFAACCRPASASPPPRSPRSCSTSS